MRPEQLLNQFRRYMPNRCGDSDDELLERFIAKNDQKAFANLLDRYAAMVMGVCQRIVGQAHFARDFARPKFLLPECNIQARESSSNDSAAERGTSYECRERFGFAAMRRWRGARPQKALTLQTHASNPKNDVKKRC